MTNQLVLFIVSISLFLVGLSIFFYYAIKWNKEEKRLNRLYRKLYKNINYIKKVKNKKEK